MTGSVLITGADRGLGFSLVELYLQKGFCVYACLHREPGVKALGLKEKYDRNLILLAMDVADDASVKNAADALLEKADSIDILINNAGVHLDESMNAFEDIDFNAAMRTLNINSLGPLRVSKAFLSFVEKGSTKVIANISSEAGSISDCWRDKEFDYCMSKAALNMQSNILQRYLKPRGIKVLAIHPGWMRTDMGGLNADIDASTAAEGISKLIEKYKGDLEGPMYMDYTGKLMNW